MTKRDLASMGVRLMAVFAVLLSVQSFASVVSNVARLITSGSFGTTGQTDWWGILVLVVPPCVMLLCAGVLWWAGNAVGHFVVGSDAWREEPQGLRISALDGVSLLLSAVGLYLVVTGIMPVLSTIGFWVLNAGAFRNGFVGTSSSEIFLPEILPQVSSLAAGSVLVFGARRIAAWLPAVRAIEARHTREGQGLRTQASQTQALQTQALQEPQTQTQQGTVALASTPPGATLPLEGAHASPVHPREEREKTQRELT